MRPSRPFQYTAQANEFVSRGSPRARDFGYPTYADHKRNRAVANGGKWGRRRPTVLLMAKLAVKNNGRIHKRFAELSNATDPTFIVTVRAFPSRNSARIFSSTSSFHKCQLYHQPLHLQISLKILSI